MPRSSMLRILTAAALVAAFTLVAGPAFAQAAGSLRGKIVDEAGQPVVGAEITLDYLGDYTRKVTLKTDSKGEFTRVGLPTGNWKLSVAKGELTGFMSSVRVTIGEMNRLEPLTIKKLSAAAVEASGLSAKEIEDRNKKAAALKGTFDLAIADIDAEKYDDAITKLTAMTVEVPNCAICFSKMGDAYFKKKDEANAEKMYLKAIEVDAKMADPYNGLASLYNAQKKFEDSAKMSAKANELTGGTGDAGAVYNQGISLWNASKIPEAKAQFEKAIQLDPKMSDAYYWLGMAQLNEGKLPDAAKTFDEYLKIAPTGQHAEMVKGILKQIKK